MAQGDIVVYNDFKEQAFKKVHNLAAAGDTVQVTLHNAYTPDIDAHQVWADTGVSSTEFGSASGYTAGGKVLGNQAVSQDNSNDRSLWDADNVTWTALGPLAATPSHGIIWNNTPTSPADPLICYVVLGTTAPNGGDYTLQWSTSPSAILTLT